jgi:hypothetical protein
MGSTRSFDTMLNEYLTYDLLKEEMIKRDYLLTKVEKDNGWKGGTLPVPFKGATASSIAFGQLSSSSDVAEDKYVRGEVSSQKEVWGTMIFNHRDLMEHDSVSEKSFLKILPGAVEEFMDLMKATVSVNLLNGSHFAKLTADATANDGLITVDHPERFEIGQKVFVDDDNSAPATGYVSTININTKVVLLVTTRGGATPVDFSANNMTTAQNAKCYHEGAQSASFTSLRESLLSAANGGSSTLYGQSKVAYPYLQAINVSGATITASNILDKVFDAYTTCRTFGKGNPNEILMSYKHLGSILKLLETSKGAFNVEPGSQKASVYGWTEITIGGVKGSLKVVGIQELDDDVIMLMDWRALKFHSNGFFRKRIAPDGKHYFEQRATSGYSYLVDMCLFGELVLSRPSYCGIIHSISY